MKKINIILEGVSLEIPPLRKDSEGYLRGGFVGVGGNDVALAPNIKCTNYPCDNVHCTNYSCLNAGCTNGPCNNEDLTTTATTEPSGKGKVLLNGLLI